MITMTEIARITGVSQPTVSRVLNGNKSVNPEVAERVLACAREHNFQPNIIARSLNGSRTCLLAVIVPELSNPFFAEVVKAAAEEAERQGYNILTFSSENQREKERRYLEVLQQYRVDGLLLAPVTEQGVPEIEPFRQLDIPWMLITNRSEGVGSAYISHRAAGRMVASHFLEEGAEQFIFAGESGDSKYSGFREGLEAAGVNLNRRLLRIYETDQRETVARLAEKLGRNGGKTGIFAHNDMEALIILNGLMQTGISVPEQALIAGFDNTFFSERIFPGLTSVKQPVEEMAAFAVNRLIGQIRGEIPLEPEQREFEAELVVRGSSDAHMR